MLPVGFFETLDHLLEIEAVEQQGNRVALAFVLLVQCIELCVIQLCCVPA